ncbi:MAG: precorrin-6y C5,15-methyltransferase (decarboxylating) subunit CbiE [Anderseniella sp.]
MSDAWLSIVGINDDGLSGLSVASRNAIDNADSIFGGSRHLKLVGAGERGFPWPVPFSVDQVIARRGEQVVVLASGDPFWYGAGGSLSEHLEPDEWTVFPAPSSFSLAASRLGWRLEETVCFGLHAAPFTRLRAVLSKGVRAICLVRDGDAVAQLAQWLVAHDFGPSRLTVLEALGGADERIRTQISDQYSLSDVNYPVSVAIDCEGPGGLSRACGLNDDLFEHDGQITKQPIRAMTLSALAPKPGEVLWDIGAGSGSIAIEWLLAAPGTRAWALESDTARAGRIHCNGERFGLEHRLNVIETTAPDGLHNLPPADAVMVSGGASEALFEALWTILPVGCRIVANAVTLESETLFSQWAASKGGSLLRLEMSRAHPLGSKRGWRAAMPIVQWSVTI